MYHVGVVLNVFGDHGEIFLGSFWDGSGMIFQLFVYFWDGIGIASNHFSIGLGSLSNRVGVVLSWELGGQVYLLHSS